MARLHLRFLGAFEATADDEPRRGFASDKERALLAYLALATEGKPFRREPLVQLFWDGFTEDTARHSLRNALYHLRKLLAPLELFHTTHQTVQLDIAHPDLWCDVLALEQVAQDESAGPEQVQQALSLARMGGELLQGLELRDCPAFNAWLTERRGRLAAQVARLEQKRTQLAAARADPLPGFLPRTLTPFFGRERELAFLADKIVDPGYDLITIAGEGGIGKTRLALALAERVRPDFPGGVWFIPLATLSLGAETLPMAEQPSTLVERLAAAIAARLSIQLRTGVSPVDQIAQRLAGPRLLLVLDNFEHLHGAELLLVDLLRAAPSLCLLVTSRRRLDLQAEYTFRLGGLPVPPTADAAGQPGASPQELQHCPSIELFVERADRRCGGLTLGEHNREAVTRICQLVEGLPLGIELAAALADQYTCAEVARAIAATVDTLSSTMADLPARHRSLRAVFEYSWQLLTQPEQAALARCAVFRGGFRQEAAAAVAGAPPAVLASLVDKSLLRQDDALRYDMHDLLRQLAAEKLSDEPAVSEATARRHCTYFAGWLHPKEDHLGDDPSALREVETEIHNLTAAWQTALRWHDRQALRQMARSMSQAWYSRGWFQQAADLLGQAVSVLRAELASGQAVEEGQAVLGRVLLEQSVFSEQLGQVSQGMAQAAEATQLGQSLGDGYLKASGNLRLAALRFLENDIRGSEEAARRGLELATQIDDLRLRIIGLTGLSISSFSQGHFEISADLDEQTLALAQAAGKRRYAGVLLSNLSVTYSIAGDFGKARDRLERALEVRRETQDRLGVGIVLLHAARLSLTLRDIARSQQELEKALGVFEAVGSLRYRAETLAHRALVHLFYQAYEDADRDARQAFDMASAVTSRPAMAVALLALARIQRAQGQFQTALDTCRQALALAREFHDNDALLPALAAEARILLEQGDWPAAHETVQQMLPLPERISFRPILGAVDAFLVASQVLAPIDPDQAQALLRRVHGRLLAAAATIDDPSARHVFLYENPTHREVLAQAAAYGA